MPRTYSQTSDELLSHLRAQRHHLARSARAFDNGDEDEASRLATGIRVLVHDSRSSRSLLTQLGLRDALRYVDTSLSHRGLRPDHPGWDAGLASMEIAWQKGGRYVAQLGNVPPDRKRPPVVFAQWWNKIIYRRVQMSRRELVLSLANTDGGAHVDSQLEDDYANLTRRNALGWSYSDSEGRDLPFEGNAARASVRQLAYELLETFETQLTCEGELVTKPQVGRNDPCLCGSGKKSKRCCGA